MREAKTLEFKQDISNTFLKTVSAYANYNTGKILFGVKDNGEKIGVKNPKDLCLDIENKINDSISPRPEYNLSINTKTNVITLTVFEGIHKPYLYKSKAYKRSDSATIEIERVELTRLILEGSNMTFELTKAKKQNLSFKILEKEIREFIKIEVFNKDILKTLELYNDKDGYTVAGELLADENTFPGIDMVRFGDNINRILDRETHDKMSILKQYFNALKMYRKYYQYEEIKGGLRQLISTIPEEAFREAIANALIHRLWDINTYIRVLMYSDKIEIISPGGLVNGISEKEYLNGQISMLRNPVIGNVFFRLNIIERFGTGVKRIQDSYRDSKVKPSFFIFENSIKIVLPLISTDMNLEKDEKLVYETISGYEMSRSEVSNITNFGKSKTISILKDLVEQGYIKSTGTGRGTKYTDL